MIKRGDKGTVNGGKARVVVDDLVGERSLGIAVIQGDGSEYLIRRMADGSSACENHPFITSKPWDSLKPGDACFVRDSDQSEWYPRIFAGKSGEDPLTFSKPGRPSTVWDCCIPAKLIDGELIPVEES